MTFAGLFASTALPFAFIARAAFSTVSCVPFSMAFVISLSLLVPLAGCLATLPDENDAETVSRVVVQWNPLECGPPHRVVLELEHEDGTDSSSSVPCIVGSLTIDLAQWGIYFGRFYGWEAGFPIRGVEPITLTVDAPVIHWQLAEPP